MIKKRFISMLVLLAAVATGAVAQTTYQVSLKNATNWQVKAGEGEYQALPLEGVAAGKAVSLKYSGWKLVKSVKAKKVKAAAEATAEDKGKMIGTDGKIYTDEAAATAAGTTAVAKIAYIGPTGHAYNHGLALALNDETSKWGWGLAWQEAIDHCSAKNTLTPVTNATWLLPSKAQWEYMFAAAGGSYYLYNGGYNWQSGTIYWSSTEADSDNAWYYGFESDGWTADSKDRNTVDVRACLAF